MLSAGNALRQDVPTWDVSERLRRAVEVGAELWDGGLAYEAFLGPFHPAAELSRKHASSRFMRQS
jgi:hypothetical protein